MLTKVITSLRTLYMSIHLAMQKEFYKRAESLNRKMTIFNGKIAAPLSYTGTER